MANSGYTITALVKELVERAERRAALPRSKPITMRIDSEPIEWSSGRRRAHARINEVNGRELKRGSPSDAIQPASGLSRDLSA
jgi:hypothetical protein